jgi:hypothetical protein
MYEEELEVAIKVRNLWLFSPSVSSLNCRARQTIFYFSKAARSENFHNIIIHLLFCRVMTKQPEDREALRQIWCVTYIVRLLGLKGFEMTGRFLFVESWKRWRDF